MAQRHCIIGGILLLAILLILPPGTPLYAQSSELARYDVTTGILHIPSMAYNGKYLWVDLLYDGADQAVVVGSGETSETLSWVNFDPVSGLASIPYVAVVGAGPDARRYAVDLAVLEWTPQITLQISAIVQHSLQIIEIPGNGIGLIAFNALGEHLLVFGDALPEGGFSAVRGIIYVVTDGPSVTLLFDDAGLPASLVHEEHVALFSGHDADTVDITLSSPGAAPLRFDDQPLPAWPAQMPTDPRALLSSLASTLGELGCGLTGLAGNESLKTTLVELCDSVLLSTVTALIDTALFEDPAAIAPLVACALDGNGGADGLLPCSTGLVEGLDSVAALLTAAEETAQTAADTIQPYAPEEEEPVTPPAPEPSPPEDEGPVTPPDPTPVNVPPLLLPITDGSGDEDTPIILTLAAENAPGENDDFIVTLTSGLHEAVPNLAGLGGLGTLYQYTDALYAALQADITDTAGGVVIGNGATVSDAGFRILYVPPQHKNTETTVAHLMMAPQVNYLIVDTGGASSPGQAIFTVAEVNDPPVVWERAWTASPDYDDVYFPFGNGWPSPFNPSGQTQSCFDDCIYFEDFGSRWPDIDDVPKTILFGGHDVELSPLTVNLTTVECANPDTQLWYLDEADDWIPFAPGFNPGEVTLRVPRAVAPGQLFPLLRFLPVVDDFNNPNKEEVSPYREPPVEGGHTLPHHIQVDELGATTHNNYCWIEYTVEDENGALSADTNLFEITVIQQNDFPRELASIPDTVTGALNSPVVFKLDAIDIEGDDFIFGVFTCTPGGGSFYAPSATQHTYLDADGDLIPGPEDPDFALAFGDAIDCSVEDAPPIALHSETGEKGWYVLFEPGADETGDFTFHYQYYDGFEFNVVFEYTRTIQIVTDAPTLTAVSANTADLQDTTINVTLTGSNFHFQPGETTVSVGGGVVVENVNVISGTSLTADFINDGAPADDDRVITLTTPDGSAMLTVAQPPQVSDMSISGAENQFCVEIMLDVQDSNPGAETFVNIVSLPAAGTLYINGGPLSPHGPLVSIGETPASIASSLCFEPFPHEHSLPVDAPYASFVYSARSYTVVGPIDAGSEATVDIVISPI